MKTLKKKHICCVLTITLLGFPTLCDREWLSHKPPKQLFAKAFRNPKKNHQSSYFLLVTHAPPPPSLPFLFFLLNLFLTFSPLPFTRFSSSQQLAPFYAPTTFLSFFLAPFFLLSLASFFVLSFFHSLCFLPSSHLIPFRLPGGSLCFFYGPTRLHLALMHCTHPILRFL